MNLTYCVGATSFGENYEIVVRAMKDAAQSWEEGKLINFIHEKSQDNNCTNENINVVFDVNFDESLPSFISARAFFPDSERKARNISISQSLIDNIYIGSSRSYFTGVLKHELGHVLGFRHEHIHPDSGAECPPEDGNWKPLTEFDSASIMIYSRCNGTGARLKLTQSDHDGAAIVYDRPIFSRSSVWHGWFAPLDEIPRTGDFNGDGKDDIVTFVSDHLRGDAIVALSNGNNFINTKMWHDWFAPGNEKPHVGDFNGDGKDDIITFVGGYGHNRGQVWVALSNGNDFINSKVWHDWFAPGDEQPFVGDFNGDGKDDIVTFLNDSNGDVYVALSNGSSFVDSRKWHNWFGYGGQKLGVGDFNGDGLDDIIAFGYSVTREIEVALSNSNSFGTRTMWARDIVSVTEKKVTSIYKIADVNGDGADDIVEFTDDVTGDVYVMLSKGDSFGHRYRVHIWFAPFGEKPDVGDFDGDGKDDIITFAGYNKGRVYVSTSNTPCLWKCNEDVEEPAN